MIRFLLIFLFSLFISTSLNGIEIYGKPRILDGDTININKYKIRLEGIDAPEIEQQCKRNYLKVSSIIGFTLRKSYFCGEISKKRLEKKIDYSKIKCISSTKDKYNRYLATCYKGNINLNKWMVKNGYAVAYKRYSKKYLRDEKHAKENKQGIWNGTFIRPEKWRKLN